MEADEQETERIQEGFRSPWCTCGAKTPQAKFHRPSCPHRVAAEEGLGRREEAETERIQDSLTEGDRSRKAERAQALERRPAGRGSSPSVSEEQEADLAALERDAFLFGVAYVSAGGERIPPWRVRERDE